MAILIYNFPAVLLGLAAIVFVGFPLVVIVNLLIRLGSDHGLPSNLPWAGVPNGHGGRLARARATLRSFFGMKELLDEGYEKYSKLGQTYVLPHLLTGPEVILPMSQVKWLVEQPDGVLSQQEVNRQFLEADHTFLHPNLVREPVHPQVIRRELTHRLSSFADDIVDELAACLAENWGVDEENWREVSVYDTMLDVVARLSNRVFVGKALCDNKDYLRASMTFDKNVVVQAAALNLLPKFLKPIAAPIVTAYDYMLYLRCARHTLPLIKERLASRNISDEKLPFFDRKAPNDYIQWALGHAAAHPDPAELDPSVLAKRLAVLCFAAIQSSVISMTNVLFDLASSPRGAEYLAEMRREVLAEVARSSSSSCDAPNSSSEEERGGGFTGRRHYDVSSKRPGGGGGSPWCKAGLARMRRVDSALRESMRLNGFVARGIMKMVVAPAGCVLPDGSTVPRGVKVGVSQVNVHRDADVYDAPDEFRAFRFVQDEGRDGDDDDDGKRRPKTRPAQPPQALVSTSPTFLAFSHGPNACPGRFFAANQLKLTLAHVALHYDIEPVAERPANKWFVGSMAPPMWSTLRVRRRRPEEKAAVAGNEAQEE